LQIEPVLYSNSENIIVKSVRAISVRSWLHIIHLSWEVLSNRDLWFSLPELFCHEAIIFLKKIFYNIFCLSVLKDSLKNRVCESKTFRFGKVFWVLLRLNVSIKHRVEDTPKLFKTYRLIEHKRVLRLHWDHYRPGESWRTEASNSEPLRAYFSKN